MITPALLTLAACVCAMTRVLAEMRRDVRL